MSREKDLTWIDLLNTAKTIRRSVRPVAPSPGFRRDLSSDLASTLGGRRTPSGLVIRATGQISPLLVIGLCLGLFAAGLALRLLRGGDTIDRR